MQIDSLTTEERDALTKPAVGTIRIFAPTTLRGIDPLPLHGAIVKINKVPLVEGQSWSAATSVAVTAASLASAITTATAETLCTAITDSSDPALVVITANNPGRSGNRIPISCFLPNYTFPSGPTLTGGTAPDPGNLIYNASTGKLEVLSTASGATTFDAGTWQAVVTLP